MVASTRLSEEQINFAEQYHPGYAKRPSHTFVSLEGGSAMRSGCEQGHAIGRPNADGSIQDLYGLPHLTVSNHL